MNKVQIIADSKNEHGQRLITAILTFPRYLLAEVNTHRMLSRNSASSRAIRFEKMVEACRTNPFIPFKWQKDHPGMQGTEYLDERDSLDVIDRWLEARDSAVEQAKIIHANGVTKQICNRLLEPFMYHTALVSGTELENFFALRAQDAAEIHFQDLAYKFLEACNESESKQLKAGEWHIPYGDDINIDELRKYIKWPSCDPNNPPPDSYEWERIEEEMVKIATVRAARISYALPGSEMKHDYEADLKLHDRLASSGHWSAFEHCARAMSKEEMEQFTVAVPRGWPAKPQVYFTETVIKGVCGNFQGFVQYRKMFDNENRKDSRLIRK